MPKDEKFVILKIMKHGLKKIRLILNGTEDDADIHIIITKHSEFAHT